MPLKTELLLALWVVVGLFSLYIGALTLRDPDAAWARHVENQSRRGVPPRRTKRWERSRVFTGALTVCIGALLLAMSGWVALERREDANAPTRTFTYVDPATGKPVTRDLTPAEAREIHDDPKGFLFHIAPELKTSPAPHSQTPKAK